MVASGRDGSEGGAPGDSGRVAGGARWPGGRVLAGVVVGTLVLGGLLGVVLDRVAQRGAGGGSGALPGEAEAATAGGLAGRDVLGLVPEGAMLVVRWRGELGAVDERAGSGLGGGGGVGGADGWTALLGLARIGFAELGMLVELPRVLEALGRRNGVLAILECQPKSPNMDGPKFVRFSMVLAVETSQAAHEPLRRSLEAAIHSMFARRPPTLERGEVAGRAVQTLRSDALPEWAVIQWTLLEDAYVLTLGEGVLEQVLRTRDGAGPSEAASRFRGETAGMAATPAWLDVVVDVPAWMQALDFALPDDAGEGGLARGRAMALALGLETTRFLRVTARVDGRAVVCDTAQEVVAAGGAGGSGLASEIWYTGLAHALPDGVVDRLIPGEATWYAASGLPMADRLDRLQAFLLAVHSPWERRHIEQRLSKAGLGDAAGRRAFAGRFALGALLLDAPRQADGWKLAMSLVLAQSDGGGGEGVVAGLDAWVEALLGDQPLLLRPRSPRAGKWQMPWPERFSPTMVVGGRWLVISHGPQAADGLVERLGESAWLDGRGLQPDGVGNYAEGVAAPVE